MNNKGFASTFILFSLLTLFLIVMSILLFTMNNSSVLNSGLKNKLINDIETNSDKELGKKTVSLALEGGTLSNPKGWTEILNDDGITTYNKQMEYEEQYGLPTPERSGYIFKGWYNSTTIGDVSIGSSENNNNYKILKYAILPGATYTITMDKAEGTASKFTVRIYDFREIEQNVQENSSEEQTEINEEDYVISEKIVNTSNNSITIRIKCPMNADLYGKLRLIIYAGEAGSTANQSMTFKNVKIGTMGTTTATKIESTNKLTYTEHHQLYAVWDAPIKTVIKAVASGGSITSTSGWTGTGETATKEVTVGETYGTLPTLANRNQTSLQEYTLKGWKSIPDGYIDLDYLEAQPGYYINTGYPLTNLSLIEVRYTMDSINKGVFGAIDVPGKKSYALVDTSVNDNKMYVYYAGEYDKFPNDITFGYTNGNVDSVRLHQFTNYDISTTSAKLGEGFILSSDDSTPFTTSSIFLFGINRVDNADGNPVKATGGSRIYYFREYDHSDMHKSLKHYYVPCQRESDNALGMYDLVTDKFMVLSNTAGQSTVVGTSKTVTSDTVVSNPNAHTIYAMW